MRQLELNPPLLIITMGYPGSGKTFFARQFAEQYKLPCISEQRIRFELFERPTFAAEEMQIINRIASYALEELMKTGQTIILDAQSATFKQRQTLYALARTHNYRTLTVWVQTDAATAWQRASRRDRRSADNKYSIDIDQQIFDRLRGNLQRPLEKEVAVVVSGKHAYKSQCLTVLRKITAVYSEELAKQHRSVSPKSGRYMPEPRRMIQ